MSIFLEIRCKMKRNKVSHKFECSWMIVMIGIIVSSLAITTVCIQRLIENNQKLGNRKIQLQQQVTDAQSRLNVLQRERDEKMNG